jgi:hypothetical protein
MTLYNSIKKEARKKVKLAWVFAQKIKKIPARYATDGKAGS